MIVDNMLIPASKSNNVNMYVNNEVRYYVIVCFSFLFFVTNVNNVRRNLTVLRSGLVDYLEYTNIFSFW